MTGHRGYLIGESKPASIRPAAGCDEDDAMIAAHRPPIASTTIEMRHPEFDLADSGLILPAAYPTIEAEGPVSHV